MTWQDVMMSKMGQVQYQATFGPARIESTDVMVKIGLPGVWRVKWVENNWGGAIRAAVKSQYPTSVVKIYFDPIARDDLRRQAFNAVQVETKTGMR